jgi:two-component sensor histidine kinase
LGKSYNNIGLVYKARKDYAKAIAYYQQSLAIKTSLHDEAGMLNTTLNLGSLYQSQLIYDTALHYADKAFVLATKLNKQQDITAALSNKGIALFGLKQYDKSFLLFTEAEKQANANSCKICFPTIYQGLGNCYLQKTNFALAFDYFNKGLEYTKANRRQENEKDFYKLIAELYYKKGDYQKAYAYKDSSEIIDKELLNKENLRQMNEMSAVYETAEKEKQIEKLSVDATVNSKLAGQRKRERNYFIIASALFLLLAGIAFKAFRSNKRKKEQLNKQNIIIEKSLAEKEVLMKEIHHRVKNNLQVVSSLLKLQSHYIKDEAALDAVKESRNRVQSMAIIHQNLYQENNLTGIDAEDYIGKLCDNLFTSYNINAGKIKLIKNISPLLIDVDTIVPLGLILNELISNSLKYAFIKREEGGTIKIGLEENNKTLLLSVYDNGMGIDKSVLENSPSFGYKMIKAFMPKLGGEINIYNEDGARIDISIKNYQLTTNE